jgi:hypothetical protein
MVEFTSETEKGVRPVTIAIALVLIAAMAVAVFFLVRRQKEAQPQGEKAAPIYVPGLTHPGDPDFEYYKHYVRIENAKATLGLTFSKARIAMISGIIANEGDRKLEAVELKVTLFDIYGKVDKEVIRYPIRPGLPPNRPMEPLEKRTFTIAIESVEQLWNPNKVEVSMSGLKYQR